VSVPTARGLLYRGTAQPAHSFAPVLVRTYLRRLWWVFAGDNRAGGAGPLVVEKHGLLKE